MYVHTCECGVFGGMLVASAAEEDGGGCDGTTAFRPLDN